MIKNYLKIALNSFARNKIFSLINVLGLAVGISGYLLIQYYVLGEQSFDKFHDNFKKIYRIKNEHYGNNLVPFSAYKTYPAVGPTLKREYPQIEQFVRLFPLDQSVVSYKNKDFQEENVFITDYSFFKIFSFKLLIGNPEDVLRSPYEAVITTSVAKKYFGSEPAIGKTISLQMDRITMPLIVKGIIDDIPENSHLKINILISYSTLYQFMGEEEAERSWRRPDFITYLMLKRAGDSGKLQSQLPDFINRNIKNDKEILEKDVLTLQPLKDVYLNSEGSVEYERSGSGFAVKVLGIISFFIIFIAWINYINLTTARAIKRSKEVGVRKVIGAGRSQLIQQFLVECLFLNFISILIALLIYLVSIPFLNFFIGRVDGPHFSLWGSASFWTQLLILMVVGTFVSGLYPALILSSFAPVRALKGTLKYNGNLSIKKVLILIQFSSSVGLIIGTYIIFVQIRYMKNMELGVKTNNTIVFEAPIIKEEESVFANKIKVFKNEMLQFPIVNKITFSSTIPGKKLHEFGGVIRRVESNVSDINNYKIEKVDETFFDVFQNKFLAGSNFSGNSVNNLKSVIINLAACQLLGYSSPDQSLQHRIIFPGDNGPTEMQIIGVIDNYHHLSLKYAYEPEIFSYGWNKHDGFYSVSLNGSALGQSSDVSLVLNQFIDEAKRKWSNIYSGNSLSYFFLDDSFGEQYKKEQQFGKLFAIFTWFSIFIALIGFMGLTSFSITQRTKEIGIRKILGATDLSVIKVLSVKFITLVLISCFIASPIAWYYSDQWLYSFAFRVRLKPFYFILPILSVISLTSVLVSAQAFITSRANVIANLGRE